MKSENLNSIKAFATRLIKQAGKVLAVAYAQESKAYHLKSRHDIQAEGDLVSEKLLLGGIRKVFPNHAILSEESGEKKISGAASRWIIDPLDGTINFSRNIPEFCISLALEQDRRIVLGLVYNPITKQLYIAERGKGAILNGKRIRVSKEKELINSILATDNSSKINTRIDNFNLLARLCPKVRHVRVMGSGALHLARLATGELDVYYKTKTNYWDYAAGALLVCEAGGKVTDLEGNPFGEGSKTILATNALVHQEYLNNLKAINQPK